MAYWSHALTAKDPTTMIADTTKKNIVSMAGPLPHNHSDEESDY